MYISQNHNLGQSDGSARAVPIAFPGLFAAISITKFDSIKRSFGYISFLLLCSIVCDLYMCNKCAYFVGGMFRVYTGRRK